MKSIFELQSEFLSAGDLQYPVTQPDDIALAKKLVHEEYNEWQAEPSYVEIQQQHNMYSGLNDLKEMCDLIYVAAQYLNQSVGPTKAQALFNAVHRNNMSKCIDGKLVKRADGKVLKPIGFDKYGWQNDFIDILEKD